MCTVTIVPLREDGHDATGYRLACNRDESTSRPAALPPRTESFGARTATMPIDPVSGGTWMAVNDAGLAFALLNVNEGRERLAQPVSRGTIIPSLLHCGSEEEAARLAGALDARRYEPFRLVIVSVENVCEVYSNGEQIWTTRHRLGDRPLMFTSSGLGDWLVDGPRRTLFRFMLAPGTDWIERQDLYHRHQWPERPELSVMMERPEARTVSHTVIEVDGAAATLDYAAA